jgi:hypothetical protein
MCLCAVLVCFFMCCKIIKFFLCCEICILSMLWNMFLRVLWNIVCICLCRRIYIYLSGGRCVMLWHMFLSMLYICMCNVYLSECIFLCNEIGICLCCNIPVYICQSWWIYVCLCWWNVLICAVENCRLCSLNLKNWGSLFIITSQTLPTTVMYFDSLLRMSYNQNLSLIIRDFQPMLDFDALWLSSSGGHLDTASNNRQRIFFPYSFCPTCMWIATSSIMQRKNAFIQSTVLFLSNTSVNKRM